MADQKSEAGKVISDVEKGPGGTYKGIPSTLPPLTHPRSNNHQPH